MNKQLIAAILFAIGPTPRETSYTGKEIITVAIRSSATSYTIVLEKI